MRRTWAKHVERFCDLWLCASNRSSNTIRAYRTDLKQFVRHCRRSLRPRDVDRPMIEEWVAHLQGHPYSASSIRRKLASLRAFYAYLKTTNDVEASPLKDIRLRLGAVKRLTRVVPWHDLTAIVHTADREVNGHSTRCPATARGWRRLRNALMIRLLCATGIRVGELVSLRLGEVEPEERTLVIHGKGNRERLAFIADAPTANLLDRYMKGFGKRYDDHVPLFATRTGKELTTEMVRRILREIGEAAGTAHRVTPHMLRHTAATTLLENGADLRIVQEFLGHESIRSTERYTHVTRAHFRKVLRRANPLKHFH